MPILYFSEREIAFKIINDIKLSKMPRKPSPGRIVYPAERLGLPLVAALGFDAIQRPINLPPHRHEGYEITYLEDGEVTWLLQNGPRLDLRGGDLAVVQPQAIHCGQWQIIRRRLAPDRAGPDQRRQCRGRGFGRIEGVFSGIAGASG
jgi:hypothetical protein